MTKRDCWRSAELIVLGLEGAELCVMFC